MAEEKRQYDAEEHLALRVDLLFSKYSDFSPSDDLTTISEYFKYLSDKIDHRRLRVTGKRELVSAFESVALLLQERLLLYPETIRKQVSDILSESGTGTTLAVVVNLPEEDMHAARLSERIGLFGRMILSILGRSLRFPADDFGLTREGLFKAKLAMARLSQILKYAATIELIDYDAAFHDLKDHYDPDLIQKSKVIALVNIMRVHVDTLPNKEIAERIIARLGRLEEEIRKPKPRWGVIIAGFLALLGFLADLKQLQPDIYTDAFHMVSQVVSVLYQDGSVAAAKSTTPLLTSGDQTATGQQPQPPPVPSGDEPVALPPRKDEEEAPTNRRSTTTSPAGGGS